MEDFFKLDLQLTDEERMIRDSTRDFVDSIVMPSIADGFEQGQMPRMALKGAANLGLFGITLPEKYSGLESSYTAYGITCQELERGDSGLRSFVSVQSSLCMYPIYKYGTESQKERFLPHMAEGNIIGCFGLTEPGSGSDPAGMSTKAEKAEGGWVLNGSKLWITNGTKAGIAIIWAKTDEGIRGFIVDTKSDGFDAHPVKGKMSLRASDTGEIFLNNCFVPESLLLPGTDIGLKAAFDCLNQARFGIAWGAMGAAEFCFDTTLEYLSDRQQFGKPLAANQLVQKDLAEMFTEISKARLFNFQLAKLMDEGSASPEMISMAKLNSTREALSIARKCRNLLGANGISVDYHIIRHMLNLESVFTYEGTENVHLLILGRYLTGINAF